jgi:hypothetical protein
MLHSGDSQAADDRISEIEREIAMLEEDEEPKF